MKTILTISPCLAALALAGCAQEPPGPAAQQALPTDKVREPAAAIQIAQSACAPDLTPADTKHWTATYADGVWYVSAGDHNGAVQVDVTAASGEPGDCMEMVIVG